MLHRGLVARDPHLRVMNESFRRFVLNAGQAQQITTWEEAAARSRWDAVKWPLLAVAILVALVLFVTRREIFDTGMIFLGALGGGIAGIFKLLEIFRAGRPTT